MARRKKSEWRPLYSLDFPSSAEGWAIGGNGLILRYKNSKWKRTRLPFSFYLRRLFAYSSTLNSIYMVSPDEGWIVGDNSTLLHYKKGRWKQVKSPVREDLNSIHMLSGHEGWAVSDNNVLHFKNGKWLKVNTELKNPGREDGVHGPIVMDRICMSSPNEGWLAASAIWPRVRGVLEEGAYGQIVHYKDGGWTVAENPATDARINDLQMISDNEGWIIQGNGNFLHYYDGKWQLEGNYKPAVPYAIHMVSANEGWAVGVQNGEMLHYYDGKWELLESPTTKSLYDIHMLSAEEGWAVGWAGTILYYNDKKWSIYEW